VYTKVDKVSSALGLMFQDPSLLARALTHTSHAAEHGQDRAASNERLEYLGDAILKAVMAEQLVHLMGDADEGRLSKVSAQAVSGQALARAAVELGVPNFIMLGHGEEASGGRMRQSNLAGAMEALFGAVYLDSGFDAARSFIIRVLEKTSTTTESGFNRTPCVRVNPLCALGLKNHSATSITVRPL
jgi:ribonuclease-3